MNRLKVAFKRLLSYFPTPLPVGMTAYKEWSDSVVDLIGPIANTDDLQFCVAAEVIRVGPAVCSAPKNYFVKRVRAGAAKQIAGAVFTEIKERQMAAQKAALAALSPLQQAPEVTTAKEAVNGPSGV